MRLSHVSVLREYGVSGRQGGYFVRAELETPPTNAWFRVFQYLWLSTPAYRKLCMQPELSRNEVLIPLADGENIVEVVDAIKNVIRSANTQTMAEPEAINTPKLNEAII